VPSPAVFFAASYSRQNYRHAPLILSQKTGFVNLVAAAGIEPATSRL
jgi:hypothetical protein